MLPLEGDAMFRCCRWGLSLLFVIGLMPWNAVAEETSPRLTVKAIFTDRDFHVDSFGPYEWTDDGDGYTLLKKMGDTTQSESSSNRRPDEADRQGGDAQAATSEQQQPPVNDPSTDHEEPRDSGTSSDNESAVSDSSENGDTDDADDSDPMCLVRVDPETGAEQIIITADQLTPEGSQEQLEIDAYQWSTDKQKVLLFANTQKVWRDNTKGDYWVLDLVAGTLKQVASRAEPSTLMFAKFSSDGQWVGYVRENNIYVEDLATGNTIPITTDGTKKLINGTFDWVYEEEFDLQDGFRFSPDGKSIAYWQLDSNGIRDFHLINNTDETYPTINSIPYPKVGTVNSSCRIGVVGLSGGTTRWMKIPGDPRNHYLASMEWLADSSGLLIEQLNRRQDRRELWRADAATGDVRSIFSDENDSWIDMRSRFEWFQSDSHRLVLSERDGWRHAYRIRLSDGQSQLITPGDYDVIELVGMESDDQGQTGWLYFTASPESAVHQYLFRVPLESGPAERVTPPGKRGFHTYNVSPNGKWAVHKYSAMGVVPKIDLVSLPDHRTIRMLVDNAEVEQRLAKVDRGPLEFLQVTIDDPDAGQPLAIDAWMIKPPGFDAAKKYPVLFYVYSEPWGQTARDVWGGDRYLWHLLVAQKGYIVATVDNRGTPAPRGSAWRKAIHGKIGQVNVHDQAEATKQILKLPYVDGERVGVWGWSGGGSMTLNAMFQHPEIYHVGMSVAPVGDQRLYDTIYQERYMGLLEDNEEGFVQGSPVTHAKNLQGDLLLVHGTGDDNVHYQNAEVVINELIKHQRPFDMMSYPNRTHGIREGEGTSQHLFELLTRYLTTHLPPGPR